MINYLIEDLRVALYGLKRKGFGLFFSGPRRNDLTGVKRLQKKLASFFEDIFIKSVLLNCQEEK